MAKTIITQITDDLDGSKGATEVAFSFDGIDYTIDLSKKNADAMAKVLKPYIGAATKVNARSGSGRRSKVSPASRKDYSKIREWARGQGLTVSDRGRVPASIVAQYEAAH